MFYSCDSGMILFAAIYKNPHLSAYDAAYLDVAVRQGAPLATLDNALQKAGRAAGIKIFKA